MRAENVTSESVFVLRILLACYYEEPNQTWRMLQDAQAMDFLQFPGRPLTESQILPRHDAGPRLRRHLGVSCLDHASKRARPHDGGEQGIKRELRRMERIDRVPKLFHRLHVDADPPAVALQ
jgi:hypothetical protein